MNLAELFHRPPPQRHNNKEVSSGKLSDLPKKEEQETSNTRLLQKTSNPSLQL